MDIVEELNSRDYKEKVDYFLDNIDLSKFSKTFLFKASGMESFDKVSPSDRFKHFENLLDLITSKQDTL